jgi:signal transduction histidine kinase
VTTFATRLPAAFARLSRRRDGGLVAGVCAGLARSARVDPTLVRLVFGFLALAGGAGVLAYAGAWLGLPDEAGRPVTRRRRFVAVGLFVVSFALALHAIGLADAVLWPAVLVATGAYLIQWRRDAEPRRTRQRTLIGAVLIVAAAVLFTTSVSSGHTGGALVAPTGLLVVLCLVVGPWIWRLAQERDAERLARIRAQERADVAARVHDSVLQTLALVQRSADDPKRVAALARRQERELRGWLYGDRIESGDRLGTALDDVVADIEELHGVRVELVRSGDDRPLDPPLRDLVLATREALANAAVHAHVDEVSLFVQVGASEIAVFVRDRGGGFDPTTVPDDRRGIKESVIGRLERAGGNAVVRSVPGQGTEIELRLPLEVSS